MTEHDTIDPAAATAPARETYSANHGEAPEHDHATAHQSAEALAAFLTPDPAVVDDTGEFDESRSATEG